MTSLRITSARTNKNLTFGLLNLCVLVILMASCRSEHQRENETYTSYSGEIIGTYYKITFLESGVSHEEIIDLMNEVDSSVSTWKDETPLSLFNAMSDTSWQEISDKHFIANTKSSYLIHQKSEGYFDPSVGPLLMYYGFGKDASKIQSMDSAKIEEIKKFASLSAIELDTTSGLALRKKHPDAMLEYSALGKGYLVDEIARLLLDNGISSFLVDIGGEMRLSGNKSDGNKWTIAINTPEISSALNDGFDFLNLTNVSIATSGNYRNNYQIGDQMIVHTINPHTGYPEINKLKSATIIAPNCMTADAWATACMSAGYEKAQEFIRNEPLLEGYFIYTTNGIELKSSWTAGMEKYLNKK